MAFYGRQFSTASPVLTVSPLPAHQSPLGFNGFPGHSPSFGNFAASGAPARPFQSTPTKTSRKRSRDEAAVNLEPDNVPVAPQEPEEEWVYGPGMTLVKASKGYVCDASTQSGTWLEEKKAAEEDTIKKLLQERIELAPRTSKLQRHEPPTMSSAVAPSVTADMSSAAGTNKTPVIDDFTLHLGIGWRKISDDEHIQAAARGWARYVENHFPLTNVQCRLESRGLQSYLMEASEGFFLFAENLRQGQLVSTTVEGTLRNLQTSPPTFDGCTTMAASDSPSPAAAPLQQAPALDAEMSMD